MLYDGGKAASVSSWRMRVGELADLLVFCMLMVCVPARGSLVKDIDIDVMMLKSEQDFTEAFVSLGPSTAGRSLKKSHPE